MVSLRAVQNLMLRIYFHRDSKRGVEGTFNWFRKEVEELKGAMQNDDRRALEDEFADVVAWLASLANLFNVDLEEATLRKYANCCPKCGLTPCKCPFSLEV